MKRLFTYPFRYIPSPEVKSAASDLIRKIKSIPELDSLFTEGKMLGVLICEDSSGSPIVINGFSGLAGGCGHVEGFAPPIFDWSEPDGYFRRREAEISELVHNGGEESPDIYRSMSADLQDWLFCQYKVLNAKGEETTVKDIFRRRGLVPPGGTGDCAAPKMLQEAYRQGVHPIAMGEFWYGRSPDREVREEGRFYPSCTGKCGPLLSYMMEGLDVEPNPLDREYDGPKQPEIIYSDDSIIVVDKPSGMLSVPGRTSADSLLDWLTARFGEVHSCHRLDMDTSGVMVFARDIKSKVEMERQFSERETTKTYRARLVSGGPFRHAAKGTIALPLSLDYYDRPRQIVDRKDGKKSVTRYEVIRTFPNGELDVRFTPLTGRSHQIRVHAAHSLGLGRPIKGDRLYGAPDEGRLMLLAESLSFTHPFTRERMKFSTSEESF